MTAAVSRTAPGLRNALFDLLDGLRAGTVKPSQARAQCEVAQRIMETVRMEAGEIAVLEAGLALERRLLPPASVDVVEAGD